MMKNPPLGFEKVVQAHFYLRQDEIMKQCEEWRVKPGRENLTALITEAKDLLDALKMPNLEEDKQ